MDPGDEGLLDPVAPAASGAEQQATEAEAGSAAAHALLQGDLLEDIVQEHARYTFPLPMFLLPNVFPSWC